MFKKGLVTLVCLTVMSALWAWAATTYSISTKINDLGTAVVRTTTDENGVVHKQYTTVIGGTIKTTVGTAERIHDRGIMYTNPLTTQTTTVEVQAKQPGYRIASITKTINGVTTPVTLTAAQKYTFSDTFGSNLKTQFLTATFAVDSDVAGVTSRIWQLTLMNNNDGGVIKVERPTGSAPATYDYIGKAKVTNYADTTPVRVTVDADDGYFIDYVVVNGVKSWISRTAPQDTYVVNINQGPNVPRIQSVVAGYKKASIPVNTANIVNGGGIAPLNPVADPFGTVRLIISPTGTYNQVVAVTPTGGNLTLTDRFGEPASLPFTGPVKATITGITGPIIVTATYGTNLAKTAATQNCTNTCHIDPSLVAAKPYIKAAGDVWAAGKHKSQIDCVGCHQTMPGQLTATTCTSCHTSRPASHDLSLYSAGKACIECHNHGDPDKTGGLNSPHYGGQAFHKAQYLSDVTLESNDVTCANCHGTVTNATILAQYAESAHADPDGDAWIAYDWRSANRSACARCHNGTAFVAKLGIEDNTSNVFAAGDVLKPGEALSCSACHTDPAAGTLRTASSFTMNGVTFNAPGASGLCVRCHSGRETGASITDSTKVVPAPHYAAAAAILYNTGGYHYAGDYATLGTNKLLGADAQGPCVACHMINKSHTFAAAGNATDKARFQVELDKLKAALEGKGIYYASTHPYFFKAPYISGRGNDGVVRTNEAVTIWASPGVMGAAFNYALLVNEPGAYAHNIEYATKLIQDSISFLAAQ